MNDSRMTQTLRMNGVDTGLVSLLPTDPDSSPLEHMPVWLEWKMWIMGEGGKPSIAEALIEHNRLARRTQALYAKLSTAEKDQWRSLYYRDRDLFSPFPFVSLGDDSGAPFGFSKYTRVDGYPLPKLSKDDK
jgi:hypothetical protein